MFNPFGYCSETLACFCIGGLVRKYFYKFTDMKASRRAVIGSLGFLLGTACHTAVMYMYSQGYQNTMDSAWLGYSSFFILPAVLSLILLCSGFRRESRIITAVSKNTLGIYFIHTLIIEAAAPVTGWIFSRLGLAGDLVSAAAVLAVSTLLAMLMKKLPVIKKLV